MSSVINSLAREYDFVKLMLLPSATRTTNAGHTNNTPCSLARVVTKLPAG